MKAAVEKESAETQEYESCQQNDLEVDRDEGMEESSLVPSAIVDATGWHKARFMCDNRCKREGFDFFDIAVMLAEDEGRPHTINHCKQWYNLSLAERNEPAVTHARRKVTIGEESSRRGAKGFAGRMWERYAAYKLRARALMAEAATAVQLEKSWPEESPYKEDLKLHPESIIRGGRIC